MPRADPRRPDRTCSQAEYEQAERRAAPVDKAIDVYREIVAEISRLHAEGGAYEPSPLLAQFTDGSYQRNVMAVLKYQKDNGLRSEGPYQVLWVREIPETADDVIVGLEACEDGRQVKVYSADGAQHSAGRTVRTTALFKMVDGEMMIMDGSSKADETCAG